MKKKLTSQLNHLSNPSVVSIIASIISIFIGLVFGFLLMLLLSPEDSFYGLSQMLLTGISSTEKLGEVLYTATPLIMTGLAIAFAFKTGLFNIGASGQYLMGAFFALFAALVLKTPWWVAIICSALGGAIWGVIPGIFKAFFNVHEVLTSIMFNWIGLFIVNVVIANTKLMLPSSYLPNVNDDRTVSLKIANPNGIIPKLGLDKIFSDNMSIAIFIAVIVAILAFIILNKTTFGYELKAVGHNKSASKYAGINEKRNIILSMMISGSFAGIGGGLYYLSGVSTYSIIKALPLMGFNGIPVALLASSHPLGTIFAALFISYVQVGGGYMQPEFAKEVIDIVIAVIIYLSAFSLLVKGLLVKFLVKNNMITNNGGDKQ